LNLFGKNNKYIHLKYYGLVKRISHMTLKQNILKVKITALLLITFRHAILFYFKHVVRYVLQIYMQVIYHYWLTYL